MRRKRSYYRSQSLIWLSSDTPMPSIEKLKISYRRKYVRVEGANSWQVPSVNIFIPVLV